MDPDVTHMHMHVPMHVHYYTNISIKIDRDGDRSTLFPQYSCLLLCALPLNIRACSCLRFMSRVNGQVLTPNQAEEGNLCLNHAWVLSRIIQQGRHSSKEQRKELVEVAAKAQNIITVLFGRDHQLLAEVDRVRKV